MARELKIEVRVDSLFLATDNPRHEEVDDEKEAVEHLCRTENVEAIAREISKHGFSPIERLIIYPKDEDVTFDDLDDDTVYVVAEGNRRVCALKLLHDPDNAPVAIRDKIDKLSQGWDEVKTVDAVVILDPKRRRHWLERIHDGVQEGRGRKPWNAEQKTRFSGTRRNIIAQNLLDYAENKEMLDKRDRAGSFSHMARLVGNPVLAEVLGLQSGGDPNDIHITRPSEQFDLRLRAVLNEAKLKNLGSQALKSAIDSFARKLDNLEEATVFRTDPTSLFDQPDTAANTANSGDKGTEEPKGGEPVPEEETPSPPKKSKYVRHEKSVVDLLKDLGFSKLESLYHSVCNINAETHTPLIAVGVWSFCECLAKMAGAGEKKPFKDHFRKVELDRLGLSKQQKSLTEALERVSENGNTAKHHSTSAQFDYRQLINDMETLAPIFAACLKDIKSRG